MTNDSHGAISIVEAEGLGFSYRAGRSSRRRLLLQDIHLEIKPGELVGLTGPSGVGKSTLGDILLGLREPIQGQVLWCGRPIYAGGKKDLMGLRRYYQKIYQDPVASFPPGQTTGQALADVIRYYQLARNAGETEKLLKTTIAPLDLGPEHLERFPHQLSGGEMQRLALARILLVEPRFLMADEPTSRLDLSVQAHIIRLIADFARTRRCAVLLISHNLKLIEAICDRGFCLEPIAYGKPGATLSPLVLSGF